MSEFKFNNSGISIEEYKKRNRLRDKLENQNNNIPLGIKLPLERGYRTNETLFKMNFNRVDQINNNLKVLLVTKKGERLGFPDFGTNLISLYNRGDLESIEDAAMAEISSSINKYFPFISLDSFKSEYRQTENGDNYYEITISYEIPGDKPSLHNMIIKIKTSR